MLLALLATAALSVWSVPTVMAQGSGTSAAAATDAPPNAPPPPDAPPPPPDYIPPPPPPDGVDPGAGFDEPPPPDDDAGVAPPPDYGAAPAEATAEGPPAPEPGGPPLETGEAYHTRFSGTVTREGSGGGVRAIDLDGVVGSIFDLRAIGEPPVGQHVLSVPQRAPATAADVGQIFGIALDDAAEPNIFVTATSAYGLHLEPGTRDWMAGMWGPESGPGTLYRLPADTGYVPEYFAEITLDGRRNTGAALGNVAYDAQTRQLYASDLETGMIHRLSAEDGSEFGRYDHGVDGRLNFLDAETGEASSLPAVAFDRSTAARREDCAAGPFERTPECWNFADFRRRIWGLAVRPAAAGGESRLFYAVWGSDGFGNPAWESAEDEQYNSVWSMRLDASGGFDTTSVRREFFLPAFFDADSAVGAMAENSRPVSDIEFAACGDRRVMLLAERGGVRNLGLGAEDAFANPHESRVLRYELGDDGAWRPAGRYDVGFYERQEHGPPRLRASAGGGCDFGYGYSDAGIEDLSRQNGFVWATGDNLCSPRGACLEPSTGNFEDTGFVDGLQGTPEGLLQEVGPEAAYAVPAPAAPVTPADGPQASYMIDSDVGLDTSGGPVGVDRNQATFSGDIDILQRCTVVTEAPEIIVPPPVLAAPLPPPAVHQRAMTHQRNASPMHNVNRSWHERSWSWHSRERSWHHRNQSWHQRDQSWHWKNGSWHSRDRSWHSRNRSWHWRDRSWHWKNGSWHFNNRSWHSRNLSWHTRARSWHGKDRSWHFKQSSWHDRRQSWHSRDRSWHGKDRSWHAKDRSWHGKDRSWHSRQETLHRGHDTRRSRDHDRQRSQNRDHERQRSLNQHHAKDRSQKQQHERDRSHKQPAVHGRAESQRKNDGPRHSRAQSDKRDDAKPAHSRTRSQQKETPKHSRAQSDKRDDKTPAHSRTRSQQKEPAKHGKAQSDKRDDAKPAHSRTRSQQKEPAKHGKSQSDKRDDAKPAHSRSRSQQRDDANASHSRSRSQQQSKPDKPKKQPQQQQQQQQKQQKQQSQKQPQQKQQKQQQRQEKPAKQQKPPKQHDDGGRHNKNRSEKG